MKTSYIAILCFLIGQILFAQPALYNSGNLQIHEEGQMAFHTNLINDGVFNQNVGLAGFYGPLPLEVSGAFETTFFDVEFATFNQVLLNTALNVNNNANFITGNVMTPRDQVSVALQFAPNAFHVGAIDFAKVDGYVAVEGQESFLFPIGDAVALRPLQLNSDGSAARSAYFFEDPSNPVSIDETFNVNQKITAIGAVSTAEFWKLESPSESTITISWDGRSGLADLANTVEDVIIVGFSISSQLWIVIPNSSVTGDLTQGFISSESFIPNDFAAITFGTAPLTTDTFAVNNPTLGNYFVSPNSDGTNDFLVIDNLEEAGSNNLQIYNRFGQKVFEMDNYNDEFNGFSNQNNLVLGRSNGLPEGVYFYIVTLFDLDLDYQGFLFLNW